MSYELIITEKPNAAKKIADALADGKPIKESNAGVPYYKVTHGKRDLIIGCAVGHLYTVAEKDKGKWAYPIFSIEWVPSADTNKASAFTKKYLNTLKKLAKGADTFTVATDYDIEGEVIGFNVLKFACKKKDANRMKFSTLTKPDLIKSYETKSEHLNWPEVNAGITRHELDWLYGINLSRALTLSIKNAVGQFKLLSSGRVQGPALKILVDKEKEIAEFKPDPYWQIQLLAKEKNEIIEAMHVEDKFWEKAKAEAVMKKVKNETKAKVAEIQEKKFNQAPPFPFDLTSLQIEAHKTLRLPPKTTLEIAQELYTGGYISYPRTSSQKLPKEIGYDKIIKQLTKKFPEASTIKTPFKPNEGKKTDAAHPAIYPTGIIPKLSDERTMGIYELIARRFLAVFGEPAVRETLTVKLDVKEELFTASGTRTITPGWHTLYGRFVMLDEKHMPKLEEGQLIDIESINLLDKETQPPRRYTAASIIKELEKRNLGTKATRAQIIENLYSRGYVNEKSIQATELGIKTCDILTKYCPDITDEQLTRHFEDLMDEIRDGKHTPEQVIEKVKQTLTKTLNKFKKHEKELGKELAEAFNETRNVMSYVGPCPNCKGELHIRKGKFGNFIACNKYPDCTTTFGLPAVMVKPAQKECETCGLPMVTLIKKRKRPQDICIDPMCKSKEVKMDEIHEVEKGKEIPCPKCGEGKLVVRKSIYGAFLGCNQYPKCRYSKRDQ